ncbi:MAG: N-acetylmuramoyl-L-alanine amidase [Alphaproteobacteria bacterium]
MVPIVDRPSPNFAPRPAGVSIDMLVLHYTGMESAGAALERLCDPRARISAHYVVDEDGTVLRLVGEESRAWHAGAAAWAGATNINDRSIAIELVNPGHEFGYRPFPEAQMAAVEELAGAIVRGHPIPPGRVLGHSDVAPQRKHDPGELFDWARLARKGIGLWPQLPEAEAGPAEADPPAPAAAIGEARALLARFGYEVAANGPLDAATRNVVAAFQRHFRPTRVDGEIDGETVARLRWLAAAIA